MSLLWIYTLSNRWRPWLPAVVFLLTSLLLYGSALALTNDSYILSLIGTRKVIGIFLLLSFLPAYLIFMMAFLWRRTEIVLAALKPLAKPATHQQLLSGLERLTVSGIIATAATTLFGASQNSYVVELLFNRDIPSPVDIAMFCGNCVLWFFAGLMLSWRINVNRQISALGADLNIDIYRLDKLQPLAQMATIEILVVAGAMAFLPLQSLDAKLDLDNYLPGISVGLPSAALLFVLPLWGAHKKIVATKTARLAELHKHLADTPREQLAPLETITAHIDRVKAIPNWPIDIRLVTRIFFYVVIAPLAWVCAALVEQLIERW